MRRPRYELLLECSPKLDRRQARSTRCESPENDGSGLVSKLGDLPGCGPELKKGTGMARGGKKVHVFKYHPAGLPVIEIPIKLDTDHGTFSVEHKPSQMNLSGKNLEVLQREIKEHLDARHKVDWQPHLAVWVSFKRECYDVKSRENSDSYVPTDDEDGEGWCDIDTIDNYKKYREQLYGVGMRVTPVMLGTYPSGEKCWKTPTSHNIRSGWPTHAGDIHYMHGQQDKDNDDYNMALIPDTAERRQALQTLFQQFYALHEALKKVMSAENLPKLLERVLSGEARLMMAGGPQRIPGPTPKWKGGRR